MRIKPHFFNASSRIITVGHQTCSAPPSHELTLGPINVFWVVGNASANSVLITDHLATNQHNGDRLRRVFPLSPYDYSLELSINRETLERTYSCVISGATDIETTLFTYTVRSISECERDKGVSPS